MSNNETLTPQIEKIFSDNYSPNQIYNMILNTISDGILIVEIGEKINAIYYNEQFYKVIKYEKDDPRFSISNITATLFESDKKAVNKNISECKNIGDGFQLIIKSKRERNQIEWYQIRAIRIDFIKSDYPVFLVRISNITNQKQLEHKLAVDHERYRIFEETTDSLLFDYTVAEDKMQFSSNESGNIKNWVVDKYTCNHNLVHPDDAEYFLENLNAASLEVLKGVIEFRTRTFTDPTEYYWFKVYYSSIADDTGKITNILGRLKNIEKEVKERNDIIKRVEKDPLTGVYNRITAEKKINEIIENSHSKMYFAVIDIDNFKKFNDAYGHIFGDKVLIAVSQHLEKLFDNGIVSRFGGDEFIMFTDTDDEITLNDKMQKFLHETYCMREDKRINISFSIGVVVSDKKFCYKKLLAEADKVMYDVKNNGKNNIIIREINGGDLND